MAVYPKVKDQVTIPEETPNGTLFVSIRKFYGKISPITRERLTLEECVRGFWRKRNLDDSHYENCKYVAAQVNGEILGIWNVDKWYPMTNQAIRSLNRQEPVLNNRMYCTLKNDDNEIQKIRQQIVGERVRLGRHPSKTPLRSYFVD